MPEFMTREIYSDWFKQGQKTCTQKVIEKTQWILQNHQVKPLDASVVEKLDNHLEESEKQAEISRK